jgi:hypothetical protein
MIRLIATLCAALALSACAGLDAAHMKGQEMDAQKYQQYTDVELAKQQAVSECFTKASTDNQIAMCALYGQGIGMASTFGGRPTGTTIAPTTGQVIKDTAKVVAPVWGAVEIGRSVSGVQAKDPIVVQQPAPVIVEPTIIEVPALAP